MMTYVPFSFNQNCFYKISPILYNQKFKIHKIIISNKSQSVKMQGRVFIKRFWRENLSTYPIISVNKMLYFIIVPLKI